MRRAAIEEGGRLSIKIETDGSPEEGGEPEESLLEEDEVMTSL